MDPPGSHAVAVGAFERGLGRAGRDLPEQAPRIRAGLATAALRFPEWRHDPALDQQFTLNVFRGAAPDDTTFSGVSQDLTAPTPPGTAPHRADPQRARALLDAHRAELRRARTATRPGTRCGECAW